MSLQTTEDTGRGGDEGGGRRPERSRDVSRSKNSWTGVCREEYSRGSVGRGAGTWVTLRVRGLPAARCLHRVPTGRGPGRKARGLLFFPAKYW